jgi:hypothetical protein
MMKTSQDEIKAKVTVPGLIKATVSVPEQLTAQVTGQVMLDPDVNLIKVNGVAVSKTNPVPVEISDGTNFVSPAKESGGNLEEIKTQADKLQFDASGSLKTAQQGTVAVTGAVDADVTGTVGISGTPPVEIKTDSVGLAKESGGNLAGAKADLDTISGQLDAKTSTLAKESGGNLATLAGKDFATQTTLAAIKAKTDNLDAASSTLAKESGGNLAGIKSDVDHLDVNLSTLAKESGGNLDAIKVDVDKIPASPSQEHATANSPHAVRITDGSSFIGSSNPLDGQLRDIDLLTRMLLQALGNLARDTYGRLLVNLDNPSTSIAGWGQSSGSYGISSSTTSGLPVLIRGIDRIDALYQFFHQANQDYANCIRPFLAFS